MHINADLHTHSIFAGGAGGGSLEKNLRMMRSRFVETQIISQLKGVSYLGTGDVQFEPYLNFLESNLVEVEQGLFTYSVDEADLSITVSKRGFEKFKESANDPSDHLLERPDPRYILQTELIFTAPIGRRRKKAHVIILFPDFESIRLLNVLLDKWGVSREKMARPFVLGKNKEDISEKIDAIFDLDSEVEVIPAHVMTPEGVYGGDLKIGRMKDFFGDSAERIKVIETGLSADPDILGMVPELDSRVLISNADAHSSALNRLGREFTSIEVKKESYSELIGAIRSGRIAKTAEFHPTEGRYFLTGHREKRKKPYTHNAGEFCYYSPRHLPEGGICPICRKSLTVGVLQRAHELGEIQGDHREFGQGPKRPFVTMVPLIEILGYTRGIKTLRSKTLFREYMDIVRIIGDESRIWTDENSLDLLEANSDVVQNIKMVKQGNFCFSPPGYDGTYGRLKIGESYDFEDLSEETW